MTDSVGALVQFHIDDSKITVVTRAARLRGVAVDYLQGLRNAMRAKMEEEGPVADLSHDVAKLDEVLVWLNEMET
jgi:hypothetical protein